MEKSFAMELLEDLKKQNKRMFMTLIMVVLLWFATIGIFVYYISNYDYEETIEYIETNDNGNGCIGDNCNNGTINGETFKEN